MTAPMMGGFGGRPLLTAGELLLGLATATDPEELTTVGVRAVEAGHRDTQVWCSRCGVAARFTAMAAHVRDSELQFQQQPPVTAVHGPGDFELVAP